MMRENVCVAGTLAPLQSDRIPPLHPMGKSRCFLRAALLGATALDMGGGVVYLSLWCGHDVHAGLMHDLPL